MKSVAVIPVRLESSRLHQKAIADICGLPMFVHTCKRAKLARTLDEVYLATDSNLIADIAYKNNIKVIMTDPKHKNSTERIAEACSKIDSDIIVNIQGDEPLLYPEHVDKIVSPMISDDTIQVAIGVSSFSKINSPSDIKAVLDINDNILYCSRNDIPCNYSKKNKNPLWKLVFIVPHRKKGIKKYLEWDPTPLEIIEDNHFVRWIVQGVIFKAIEVDDAKISVDTDEDLKDVIELMKNDKLKFNYMNR